jgi:hypothetical protein
MLKNPTSMTEIVVGEIQNISRQVSPASLPAVCAGYCHEVLVDESRMIITQMGKQNRSKMVALQRYLFSPLVVWWLSCLPLDPRFAG